MPARPHSTPRRPRQRPAGRVPSTAPGLRARNKDAIRKRIVTAALSLFQSKGFDETSTKAIARKAGIAEGTVFNYFRTKDDIALHFFELEVDHAIESVRGNPRLKKAPLEEKLFALVQGQFEYLAPYEKFIGAAVLHAMRPSSKLGPFSLASQALTLRYMEFVQELIEESLPKGQVSALPFWGPRAFWIFYLGTVLYWLHDSSEGKQDTLAFLDRSLTMGVRLLAPQKHHRR